MYIFTAIVFGVITAMAAANRGRSWLGWFILGALFPVIALVAVLVMPNLKDVLAELKAQVMNRPCLFCKEPIRKDAIKCKHCGSEVEPVPVPTIIAQEEQ